MCSTLAPPVVTRLVAELEAHLGARLLNRTTPQLALTEVGEAYLERVRPILIDVEEAEALASAATTEPRGHLRVLAAGGGGAPAGQAPAAFPATLTRMSRWSSRRRARWRPLDEAFDLTIIAVRSRLQGDFVARRLARSEVVICASPEYLDRRGRPTHPSELAAHDALMPPLSEMQRGLTFINGLWGDDEPSGETVTPWRCPGARRSAPTHIDTMYAAALAGMGVAGLPSFVLEDALLEHALERVLPSWRLFNTDAVGRHAHAQAPAGAHASLPGFPAAGLRRRGPRSLAGRRRLRNAGTALRPH